MKTPWNLIDGHLDETLSPEEAEQLRAWLRQDRQHLRTFVTATSAHASLASAYRRGRAADGALRANSPAPAGKVVPLHERKASPWMAPALAASVALGLGIYIFTTPALSNEPLLGNISDRGFAVERDGRPHALKQGDRLLPGDVLKTEANARAALAYRGEDTRVELKENTVLKVLPSQSGKRLQVLEGSLKLAVAPQPKQTPMILETPQTRVKVIGTKFNVLASPKTTRVGVTEGKVQLLASDNSQPTTVEAGTLAISSAEGLVATEPIVTFIAETSEGIVAARTAIALGPNTVSIPAVPGTTVPACPTGALPAPPESTGAILREYWFDVRGGYLEGLKSHTAFPHAPSGLDYPTSFETLEGGMETDFYGSRWRGYVHPPATGNYTFWIAADDAAELYLSTDDSPAHARLIASASQWTAARQWTKFASQESASIHLEKGRRYYIEALHQEGGGGDHVGVAWQPPGGELNVIAGEYLSPFKP